MRPDPWNAVPRFDRPASAYSGPGRSAYSGRWPQCLFRPLAAVPIPAAGRSAYSGRWRQCLFRPLAVLRCLAGEVVHHASSDVAQLGVGGLGQADQMLERVCFIDGVALHHDADRLADGLPGLEGFGEVRDRQALVQRESGMACEQGCGVTGVIVECVGTACVEVESADRGMLTEDLDAHL